MHGIADVRLGDAAVDVVVAAEVLLGEQLCGTAYDKKARRRRGDRGYTRTLGITHTEIAPA